MSSNIPQEIEEEILLRLPVKSILRFKSVCRSWYTLLCSPKFVNEHDRLSLTNKIPRLMIRDTKLLVDKGKFYSIDYASIISASSSSSSRSTTYKCEGAVLVDDPMIGEDLSTRYIQILGSCNGVLCLGVNENRALILWNPYTKECKESLLPSFLNYPTVGFGYDSKKNNYKLACVASNEVYASTVGSDLWRRVHTTRYDFNESGGLLLNGVLHWLGTIVTVELSEAIVAFDISSEKLMNMQCPGETITLYPNGCRNLKVLGDSLCLVCGARDVRIDVWVMQKYGVTESWTKKFTTTNITLTSYPSFLRFCWSFENGEILIQHHNGFGLYDQQNDRVRLLNINDIGDSYYSVSSQSYVESLVSLSSNRNFSCKEEATVSSIPQEIEQHILLRSPLKSILRFKSVCKSWYTLLSSPEFVNYHLRLTKNNPRLMIRNTNPRLKKDMFYSIDYASSASSSLLNTCKCEGAVLMDIPMNGEFVSTSGIQIVGSCNGLLCLSVNDNHALILWNPCTRECKKIPLPGSFLDDATKRKAYGLGYDSNINSYKLVCIVNNGVYVCTSESDMWNLVDTTTYYNFHGSGGLLLNGILHWLGTIVTQEISKCIFAFDVSSEKFQNFQYPEETIRLYPNRSCDLTVLGDSLCLVCRVPNVRADVWVMRNYGANESWTKKFTITQETITSSLLYSLKFYWSFENGEILLQFDKGFCLYDPKNDSVRLLNINGIEDYRYDSTGSESFVESLVSLSGNRT